MKPRTRFNTILVDGDVMLYAQAWVLDPNEKTNEPLQPAMSGVLGFRSTIHNLKEKFGTDNLEIVLTGDGNFREEVAVTTPYKGSRRDQKPVHFYTLKQALIDHFDAKLIEGEEADDYLSYTQSLDPEHTVVVTVDKDAKNTRGWFFNPRTERLDYVDQQTADYNFWYQMLVGDSVDSIQGCKGYGKAKAKALLSKEKTYHELECIVGMCYATNKHYDDPETVMLEMGRLLWMRREPNQQWEIGLYGINEEESTKD